MEMGLKSLNKGGGGGGVDGCGGGELRWGGDGVVGGGGGVGVWWLGDILFNKIWKMNHHTF